MTHIPASALADQARKHLDEAGPLNTCLSNGPERWTHELGLPTLGTTSVSEAVRRAKAGHNGYRYHEGTAGLSRGHIGVWSHEALGSAQDEHVCIVDDVDGAQWRGIGSGTPSGKVARQPASGGMNPKGVLVGYIVAPTESTATASTPTVKPAAVKPATSSGSSGDYVVKAGDGLLRIAAAHGTTVKAILRANPATPNHRSADHHIANANLIIVGQRIRIPK